VVSGKADLLYVAPERLQSESFQRFIQKFPIAVFAIDEAHCVSQWGHDFRPEYLTISEVTDNFPNVPRIALTATADAVTRQDILDKLKLGLAAQFVSSFDRANIYYRVLLKNKDKQQLYDFIQSEHSGDPGIVYVRTRRRADQIASWLQEKGLPAFSYHAGLDPQIRTERQRQFLHDDGLIIVATIAFGMGIDKPDVRFVAHLDLPASMEAYYQETGRAGCENSRINRREIKPSNVSNSASWKPCWATVRPWSAVAKPCWVISARRTRRRVELVTTAPRLWKPGMEPLPPRRRFPVCIAAHLTDILVGNPNQRILRLRHDKLKTFGAGKELSPKEWRSVYRQLLAAGMLSVNIGKISGYRLTEKSWTVLRGERKVRFRKDPLLIREKKATNASTKHQPDFLNDDARQLFEKLRRLRLDLSKKLGVPPFVIFHDKTLTEMAVFKPNSRGEFLQINGVGEQKAEKFGDIFLNAINEGSN
jgi:ATP-dependent DNA helicase RecQ